MDTYVIVDKTVDEKVPVVQGIDVRFEADLKKLRELPFKGDFKSVESESFKFIQDGREYSIHIKVQQALSNPGPIGIFLHHDEEDKEDSKLSLNDWSLGVILPSGEKHVRSMRGTYLGMHGMGWPSFIEVGLVPLDASSVEVLLGLNRVKEISLGTK